MIITGRTKVIGLIGYPVEHSLSPLMHNRAFKELGLNYCYVTFPVEPSRLEDAIKGIRALNIKGVNVTVPHKENVMKFLNIIDEEARDIGAVNTIVNKDGILTGYNTDGRGFMASLNENCIDVSGKNVLLLGAGGASKAIAYYLSKKAKALYIYDIDKEKTKSLVNSLKVEVKTVEKFSGTVDADIIINATPLGLKEDDPCPIDPEFLRNNQIVCDLIYKKTSLLKESKKRGCLTLDGLGMLLWQGVFAFELWTGLKPPVEVMRKVLGSIPNSVMENN